MSKKEVFNYNIIELILSNKDYIISKFDDEFHREMLKQLLTPDGVSLFFQFNSINFVLLMIDSTAKFIISGINFGASNNEIIKSIKKIGRKYVTKPEQMQTEQSIYPNMFTTNLLNDAINIRRNVTSLDEYFHKIIDLLFKRTTTQYKIMEIIDSFKKEPYCVENNFSRQSILYTLKCAVISHGHKPLSDNELQLIKAFQCMARTAQKMNNN